VRKQINAIPISNIFNLEQSITEVIEYRLSGVASKTYIKQITNDITSVIDNNKTELINTKHQTNK